MVPVDEPAGRAGEGPGTRVAGVVEALRRERAEAAHRLDVLTSAFEEIVAASADSNADDEHDPEGTTIAFERSQVDASVRATRERLVEIDAALARHREGVYGTCERCGQPIAVERLAVRPTARTCITCASRAR